MNNSTVLMQNRKKLKIKLKRIHVLFKINVVSTWLHVSETW